MSEEAKNKDKTLQSEAGQRLILPMVLAVACALALGLSLVWLNIERTKLAYKVRTMQRELLQRQDLNAKLGVEREHLLSPHALGKKAEEMGLRTARPGQIRRVEKADGL